MMQFFRKYGAPVFAASAFLLLVWMVWDLSGLGGSSGLSQRSAVGKINGSKVDSRLYQVMVQQAIDSKQRQGGSSLGAEEVEQVRNDVWEQVIQQRILETEFDRRRITASPDEVADAIRNSPPPEFLKAPDFQTDSQFDIAKYQRWLQSTVAAQIIPQLEAQYTQEIMRSKLLRVVTADVYLSDAALWEQYRDTHEQVKIMLAAIIPRNAVPDSSVKVTPDQVDKYYQAHRDDFKRPRTAYLSYISLPRLADQSDTAAALAQAQAVRKEIVDGAPFAEVAKRVSSDTVSGNKGGDLGEWTRGSFDPAFDAVAFSQPINALSQPVLSQFGYHLIQVTERKGNKAKGRHILIKIEVTGTHRDQLDAEADSLERLGAGQLDPAALDTVARVLGLQVRTANPVQEGTRVQIGVQVIPDAGVWAFRAKRGETSNIIELDYTYLVFRLDSLDPAGVPPLEKIRPSVEIAARDEAKWDAARQIGKDLVKRISEGSTLEQAATALHLPHQAMGPFPRINPPLPTPLLVGTAFGLDSNQISGILDTKDGIYLIQSLSHVKADSADFTKNIDELRAKLIRQARQDRVRSYLAALRDKARIEDNRADLFRTAAQAEAEAEAQQAGKK